MTAPARVRVIEKLRKNAWVEIEVHEGKKREVRRMFEALNYFVEKLIRVKVGPIELGSLADRRVAAVVSKRSHGAQNRRWSGQARSIRSRAPPCDHAKKKRRLQQPPLHLLE